MAIKFSELYELVKGQDIVLVAGENGIDNMVRWVHMVETSELAAYLEGGEVAFTIGIGLKSENDLFKLVKNAFKYQASGMVINVGPFIKDIPDEVIQFCNDNDFPIIQVPWSVYIPKIMRKFSYEITVSDRINVELSNAIKNAIFFEDQVELYVAQLERYNFRADWSYCLAVIEIVELDGEKMKDKDKYDTIVKNIEFKFTYMYKNTFILDLDGRIILVFAQYTLEHIKEIVEKIKNECIALLSDEAVAYFCIGGPTKNIKCIAKSYRKALKVVKLQKRRSYYNEVTMYTELSLYKVLMSLDDQEIIKEYYSETIEPLINYDALNKTDYMVVLEKYLAHNGSVKEVAAQLYVHRNTINYKIKKIEEILSCDLSELKTRMVYSISLMLREIN